MEKAVLQLRKPTKYRSQFASFPAVHTVVTVVCKQFYKTFSHLFLIFGSLLSSFGSQDQITDSETELTGNQYV